MVSATTRQNSQEVSFEGTCLCLFFSIPFSLSEMDSTLGDTQFSVLGNLPPLPPSLPSFPPTTPPPTDHENAIMYRLQDVILEQASALLALMELTAELDW